MLKPRQPEAVVCFNSFSSVVRYASFTREPNEANNVLGSRFVRIDRLDHSVAMHYLETMVKDYLAQGFDLVALNTDDETRFSLEMISETREVTLIYRADKQRLRIITYFIRA
ncbi:hypothetical protein [Vibrio phage vB_VpaS_VP-RY-9]|nr:hypothetical protein [Vibrio phage vB_VpaS_VP-RY-9]